jgi:lipoate-protein ligase B
MQTGKLIRFANVGYPAMQIAQQNALRAVADGGSPPVLFLGTHPPLITLGRRLRAEDGDTEQFAAQSGLPTYPSERGGEATLHGPGQLVGYPIITLRQDGANVDLHGYLHKLEQILIESLASFAIAGVRKSGFTGVWVGGGARKIASIGIAVRSYVTYHGFALNVENDLSLFKHLRPCGLDPNIMTSMVTELDHAVDLREVEAALLKAMSKILGIDFRSGEAGCSVAL